MRLAKELAWLAKAMALYTGEEGTTLPAFPRPHLNSKLAVSIFQNKSLNSPLPLELNLRAADFWKPPPSRAR